jgi:prepilin-type N-terminal cleavage/methylation domain-containing protein
MRNDKGFTLIELAVVLAIIAVLAAILTPLATNYLDQARTTRAMADTRTIADAIRLYKRDTGYYPLYTSLSNAKLGTTSANILAGPGTSPDTTQGDWSAIAASTTGLVAKLNTVLSGLAANDPNPGKISYRGPYIGALDSDPWGNQYMVPMNNLAGSTNRGFVVSSGPDGKLQTVVAQGTSIFVAGGDDIATTIN